MVNKKITKKNKVIKSKKVNKSKTIVKKNNSKLSNVFKDSTNIIILLLGIIIIGLISVVVILSVNSNDNDNDNEIEVKVIGAELCKTCNLDSIYNGVKSNFNLDLDIENEKQNKDNENLGDFFPVILFELELEKVKDWETKLKPAFKKVTYDGEEYYKLSEDIVKGTNIVTELEENLNYSNGIVIGDKNAPITIYEISDFECPYCALSHGNEDFLKRPEYQNYNPIFPNLNKYIESGEVKVIFINLPVPALNHLNSNMAHNYALCANEEGKFKEYSDLVFGKQGEWKTGVSTNPETIFLGYATQLGINNENFKSCVKENKFNNQIKIDKAFIQSKISKLGTPTYVIGKKILQGAQDFSVIEKVIKKELESK
jgi:protein-disulfide isomerase